MRSPITSMCSDLGENNPVTGPDQDFHGRSVSSGNGSDGVGQSLTNQAVLSELIFQGLVRGAMSGLMAIGVSLIFQIRIVNFARGKLFMLGTYVMYFVAAVLSRRCRCVAGAPPRALRCSSWAW